MDERSNRDPRAVSTRKKAFAREILRRRRKPLTNALFFIWHLSPPALCANRSGDKRAS